MPINKNTLSAASEADAKNEPMTGPASLNEMTEDERIEIAAMRVLERFRPAFEELAK